LISDPKNPALYTNRAMARLKMALWDSVISDCLVCLQLAPDNMKAHYYLAQAYLALKDFNVAVKYALRAHELCIASGDKSLTAVTNLVLRCKKERWEDEDRRRKRGATQLETEVLVMMERERDEALKDVTNNGDRREISREWETKLGHMRRVFENSRGAEEKRREVPDWAVDDISFGIMVDPVIVSPPLSTSPRHVSKPC
jgi:STIP1 family protein 1